MTTWTWYESHNGAALPTFAFVLPSILVPSLEISIVAQVSCSTCVTWQGQNGQHQVGPGSGWEDASIHN